MMKNSKSIFLLFNFPNSFLKYGVGFILENKENKTVLERTLLESCYNVRATCTNAVANDNKLLYVLINH